MCWKARARLIMGRVPQGRKLRRRAHKACCAIHKQEFAAALLWPGIAKNTVAVMTLPRILLTALLPFAAGYFMSYLLRAVNAVVAPDLVQDLGLTPAELGLLTAAYLGAFALFQLPLGVLLDRYGPRTGAGGASVRVAALGCLAFAFAEEFIGLFAARAMIGLGFSAGLMASYKSSATWVPIERRSLANTAIMSFGALGLVVATEPTQYLVAMIGWRNAFVVFAGLILLAAALHPHGRAPEGHGGRARTAPPAVRGDAGHPQDTAVLADRATPRPHLGRADRRADLVGRSLAPRRHGPLAGGGGPPPAVHGGRLHGGHPLRRA
jgi:MFS family permease